MLLQRCTDKVVLTIFMVALLNLAGCGATTPFDKADKDRPGESTEMTPGVDPRIASIPDAALTLFEQAVSAMAAGDYVDAELRFKEFLLQYPEYPGAHVNLAIIHSHNGDDAAAAVSVDAALTVEPDHPAALNQLGMLLRRNGKFLEAEAAYLKAVTVSPEYALAHYNLGVLNELYLQRLDAALRSFETYQSLVGDDKQVAKWITDLTRRVAANQRSANVAD